MKFCGKLGHVGQLTTVCSKRPHEARIPCLDAEQDPPIEFWPDEHATPRPKPGCTLCGVWVCETCYDFRRKNADRRGHQVCGNCGEDKGRFETVHHRTKCPAED